MAGTVGVFKWPPICSICEGELILFNREQVCPVCERKRLLDYYNQLARMLMIGNGDKNDEQPRAK